MAAIIDELFGNLFEKEEHSFVSFVMLTILGYVTDAWAIVNAFKIGSVVIGIVSIALTIIDVLVLAYVCYYVHKDPEALRVRIKQVSEMTVKTFCTISLHDFI